MNENWIMAVQTLLYILSYNTKYGTTYIRYVYMYLSTLEINACTSKEIYWNGCIDQICTLPRTTIQNINKTCNNATKIPYSTTLFKSLFYAFQGNNNDDNNDHLKHSAVAELL